MSNLLDPEVQALLSAPNHGVISTQNGDGSILSTVVWVGYEDGRLSVNTSRGRRWATNLDNDPHATLVVYDPTDPYTFVEVRGTVSGATDGAEADVHKLAHKYIGRDYPWLQPGEERVRYELTPERVRFMKPLER
jgi:PPOX class probable F420-dependent enzyme